MSKIFKILSVLLLTTGLSVFIWEFSIIGNDSLVNSLITAFVLIINALLFYCVGDLWSRVRSLEKTTNDDKKDV